MVRAYLSNFQQLSSNVKFFLLGNAIQGMGLSIYGLLFNLYLKELGYGETTIGSLISTSSLGIALMAIPAALIIERFHVKPLVVTGMLLSSGFYFIQVLNTDQSALFTFGLLASMFQALYNISVSPFYLRNSTREMRVHLFTLNSSLNIGAHMVGFLIGGYLPEMVRATTPDSSKIEIYRISLMVALSIVFLSNFLFLQIKRVPIPRLKKPLFEGLREKDWSVLSKLIIPKLCFAFGGGMAVPFINIYLKTQFQLSTKMIGVAYALLQFFIFIGIFVTPAIMKHTSQLRFILITSVLAVPFMLGLGLSENVGIVLSCFFMRGMLMNMGSPISSIFEMEHVREKDCVFASAIILFFYHLVYTFSTRLGGQLIETYSFGPTFFVGAAFYAAAVVLYYRFFKNEEKDKERKLVVVDPAAIPEAA